MPNNLTTSTIARQNVLNNTYAIEEAQIAIGLKGVPFKGEYRFTKKQVATFFEVSERSITTCLSKNEEELQNNGYEILSDNSLKEFKLASVAAFGKEVNFPTKSSVLGVFNFRALVNIAMLLSRSDKAREVRSLILDIVIDTINKKTGGSTKYINQRDEDFIQNLITGMEYHRQFLDALRDYVDMGQWKYPFYINKIYVSIFKEEANEYRKLLRLDDSEGVRNTMYSEVLDLIASYETGFADLLRQEYERTKQKLSEEETAKLFHFFESMALWKPLREKARTKMASRDLCFRNTLHHNLQEYVKSVPRDDFERFLGERSMSLDERLSEYEEVLKRLKERE